MKSTKVLLAVAAGFAAWRLLERLRSVEERLAFFEGAVVSSHSDYHAYDDEDAVYFTSLDSEDEEPDEDEPEDDGPLMH